jgi:drug/metabolite transporter (DMT)-like permease
MTGGAITLAAFAALGAAAAFGFGVALQHYQARQQDNRAPLRLIARLARSRRWLAGVGLAVVAYGLQGLALAFGPLALVAPIVATDLLFALPAAAFWERRSMRRSEWAGCGLVGAGVGVFVASSPPPAGRSAAPATEWLAAFGIVGVIAAAAVAIAVFGRTTHRAALLAIAGGVVFGLTAAVTLSFSRLLRSGGLASILGHWQPWALLGLGIAGVLLSASAYQAGALRTSLPIMDTLEPVSAVLIGTAVFGERLAGSPGGLALQLCAGATAVAGIVVLGRSPLSAPAPAGPPRQLTAPVPAPRRSDGGATRAAAGPPERRTADVTRRRTPS